MLTAVRRNVKRPHLLAKRDSLHLFNQAATGAKQPPIKLIEQHHNQPNRRTEAFPNGETMTVSNDRRRDFVSPNAVLQ